MISLKRPFTSEWRLLLGGICLGAWRGIKSPWTSNENAIKERNGSLKELVDEAIRFYLKPSSNNIEIAVEKIWDAFERAKTIHAELDKKQFSEKLISDISRGQKEYGGVLRKEFKELTDLGNNFRIRHHETNRIDFISDGEREYFFNRCLALLLLISGHIKESN